MIKKFIVDCVLKHKKKEEDKKVFCFKEQTIMWIQMKKIPSIFNYFLKDDNRDMLILSIYCTYFVVALYMDIYLFKVIDSNI